MKGQVKNKTVCVELRKLQQVVEDQERRIKRLEETSGKSERERLFDKMYRLGLHRTTM